MFQSGGRDRHHQGRHSLPPPERLSEYGAHVRHLIIGSDIPAKEALLYLRSCPTVKELIILSEFEHEAVLDILSKEMTRLRILSVHLGTLFSPSSAPYTHCCHFSTITHLEIIDANVTSGHLLWLANIPNLTHLALNIVSPSVVEFALKAYQGLKMLVLLYDYYPPDLSSLSPPTTAPPVPQITPSGENTGPEYFRVLEDLSNSFDPLHSGTSTIFNQNIPPTQPPLQTDLASKIVLVNMVRWDQDWRRGGEEFWKLAEERARSGVGLLVKQ